MIFLCLASFTFYVFKVHPCCRIYQHFTFFFNYQTIFHQWLYHILLIHSSIDGHLNCIKILVIINNAAIDIYVQILGWIHDLASLGSTLCWGISDLYDDHMLNYLGKLQIIFQSSYATQHSYQHCMKLPIFPHSCQHFLLVFLVLLYSEEEWH